jgi:predicted GNAT superfamily acetyltransferase
MSSAPPDARYTVRTLAPEREPDRAALLRINASNRPAVAPLDRAELSRLIALGALGAVAVDTQGAIAGYLLAFAHSSGYDGEEFRHFRALLGESFLYVDQVAVDPNHRGRGAGRALYVAASQWARTRGLAQLCCEVNIDPPNRVSLEWHERLGFAAVGNGDTLDGRRVAYLVRDVPGAEQWGR